MRASDERGNSKGAQVCKLSTNGLTTSWVLDLIYTWNVQPQCLLKQSSLFLTNADDISSMVLFLALKRDFLEIGH